MASRLVPVLDNADAGTSLGKALSSLHSGGSKYATATYAKVSDTELASVLDWVSPLPYEEHHIECRSSLHSDAGAWVLKEEAFTKWAASKRSSVLRLVGEPGSGKTSVVSCIVDHLKQASPRGSVPTQLAYVYIDRVEAAGGLLDYQILTTILKQLAVTVDGTCIHQDVLAASYSTDISESSMVAALLASEILDLILSITRTVSVTLILDGIVASDDQFTDSGREAVFRALDSIISNSQQPVRILLSGTSKVKDVLKGSTGSDLSLHSIGHSNSIATYLKTEIYSWLSRNSSMKGVVGTGKEKDAIEALSKTCNDKLQTQCLSASTIHSEADLLSTIQTLPRDLEGLYTFLLNPDTHSKSASMKTVYTVCKWLIFVERPFSAAEILSVISVSGLDDVPTMTPEDVEQSSNRLIVLDEDKKHFRFVNRSLENHLKSRDEFSAELAHTELADLCLRATLKSKSKQDWFNARDIVDGYCRYMWLFHTIAGLKSHSPSFDAALSKLLLGQSESPTSYEAWASEGVEFATRLGAEWTNAHPIPMHHAQVMLLCFSAYIGDPPNPFVLAAALNSPKILDVLYQKDPQVIYIEVSGNPIVSIAESGGAPDAIKWIVANSTASDGSSGPQDGAELAEGKGENADGTPDQLGRALLVAVDADDTERVQTLLTEGAKAYDDNYERQPINAAASRDNADVCALLFKSLPPVEDVSFTLADAARAASRFGNVAILKMLKTAGMDFSDPEFFESAAQGGCADACKFFIEQGADSTAISLNLITAASKGHIEVVKAILSIGDTSVDAADDYGYTPLISALLGGREEVALLLIDKGANLASFPSADTDPLAIAAEHGLLKVVERLIERGASMVAKDDPYEMTPLRAAIEADHIEVVRFLLEHGADPSHALTAWSNAYSLAVSIANLEVAELLKAKDNSLVLDRIALKGGMQRVFIQESQTFEKQLHTLDELLRLGATVEGEEGAFCLFIACNARNAYGIDWLLRHGASAAYSSVRCGSALQAACLPKTVDSFGSGSLSFSMLPDLFDDLARAGLKPDTISGLLGHDLQAAAWAGSAELVSSIIRQGGAQSSPAGLYKSALETASARHCHKALRVIIDEADPEDLTKEELSKAFQRAACYGQVPSAEALSIELAEDKFAQEQVMMATSEEVERWNSPKYHKLGYRYDFEDPYEEFDDDSDSDTDKPRKVDLGISLSRSHFENPLRTTLGDLPSRSINQTLKILLSKGADIHWKGNVFYTSLQAAAFAADERLVRYLIQQGVDVNKQGGFFGSALCAAASGDGDAYCGRFVSYLDEGDEELLPKVPPENPRIGNRCLAVVEALLEAGADVNALGGGVLGTPLSAAAYSKQPAIVQRLIDAGAVVVPQGVGSVGSIAGFFATPLLAAVTDLQDWNSKAFQTRDLAEVNRLIIEHTPEEHRKELVEATLRRARQLDLSMMMDSYKLEELYDEYLPGWNEDGE